MDTSRCRTEKGFTLIELVVVLAILGILIALAVPRYAASGRNAIVPEADNVLNELRTTAWAYYQRHMSWNGLTAANFMGVMGFSAPAGSCWTFDVNNASDTSIDLRALGNPSGGPARCNAVGPAGSASITLTLRDDGSSSRTQALP
jgi:prepilin-type N-terminal cleavage/methylation domain-containing protein